MSTPENTTEFLAAMDAARPDTRPSIRERHIETLYDMMIEGGNNVTRKEVGRYYDAILTELQEPSEATLAAGDNALPPRHDDESLAIWQAMIQHIKDGGS